MKFRTIGSAAVLIFLLPCVLFILVQSAEIPAAPIQTAMILMLLADVLFCGIWCIRQSEREDRLRVLLFGILSAGMILRIGYMLYTPAWVRGHDVGAMHTEGGGHAAYLLTLLETHGLPQSKSGQFYQQPMYYLLAAPLSYLLNLICGTQKDPYALVDGAKVLSCIVVCYSLALIVPIGRTLKMKTEGICIAAAVTAFVPNFFLTAGRVGPDALTLLFMTLAFWLTAVWMESHSWKNTILLALVYGFAVSTKISCATIALFTAACMILTLKKENKTEAGMRPTLIKLLVFGAVALPIGMWYSIRNLIRFGQEIGYVMVISKTSELYLGEESLLRLFLPYPNEYFATPYADPWNDASYPVYLLKTALFGEFTYEIPTWIPVVLLNLNLIVVLLAIVGGIRLFARKDADKYPYLRFGVPIVWALLYVSCVSFNITLPYGCSMDFRYLVFTAMLGAVCLGDFFSDLCVSEQKTAVALRSFITVICALFSLGSAVMFCMI
ncbi:MAG: glycosyltransferase family 39 protein [Ruminococcus sp.]|nr:glycosyltransferase family 39 protein [Ruminococcus sp.]